MVQDSSDRTGADAIVHTAIIRDGTLTPIEKMVWIAIYNSHGARGWSSMRPEVMAGAVGMGRTSAYKALGSLRSRGLVLVAREGRGGRRALYRAVVSA